MLAWTHVPLPDTHTNTTHHCEATTRKDTQMWFQANRKSLWPDGYYIGCSGPKSSPECKIHILSWPTSVIKSSSPEAELQKLKSKGIFQNCGRWWIVPLVSFWQFFFCPCARLQDLNDTSIMVAVVPRAGGLLQCKHTNMGSQREKLRASCISGEQTVSFWL